MRGGLACALVVAAGCYAPRAPLGVVCDPGAAACPDGQRCLPAAGSGFACQAEQLDAGGDASAPGDAAPSCVGAGLIHDLCLSSPPGGSLILAASLQIDTALTGPLGCHQLVTMPGGGPTLCVLAAKRIVIGVGGRVRAIGPNPLVLVGTESIEVDGTLDVSSNRAAGRGAAARATCGTGSAGTDALAAPTGGGGGAGGTFGGRGGLGGAGSGMVSGGVPAQAVAISQVVGGCPGGKGGQGAGGGGGGDGGPGGGAIYLISPGGIFVKGTILAGGGGGDVGLGGAESGGGGGGGGSGGLIALDAPSIAVVGTIQAAGGGGGGGNGHALSASGSPGTDATSAERPALGGGGGDGGGGSGGAGDLSVVGATAGGGATATYAGGGGGGGGGGLVLVFGVPAGSLGGKIVPPPR